MKGKEIKIKRHIYKLRDLLISKLPYWQPGNRDIGAPSKVEPKDSYLMLCTDRITRIAIVKISQSFYCFGLKAHFEVVSVGFVTVLF